MIFLLLALALPAMAQSTGTVNTNRLDGIDTSVQSLLSGRPNLTGYPTLAGGASISSSAFTGANTHAGSETQLSGSSFALNSGSYYSMSPLVNTGNWIWTSSASYDGSNNVINTTATITLTNYAVDPSSINWRVEWNCYLSSASLYLFLGFNADTGARYSYDVTRFSATSLGADGGNTDHGVNTDDALPAGASARKGSINFSSVYGGVANSVSFDGRALTFPSAQFYQPTTFAGLYSGTAALSSIYFTGSTTASSAAATHTGLLRCHFDLWRQGYQFQ